jgi:hypothetical protein
LYDRKYGMTADNQLVILDASESDQKAYRWIRMSGCFLVGLCNIDMCVYCGVQTELLCVIQVHFRFQRVKCDMYCDRI